MAIDSDIKTRERPGKCKGKGKRSFHPESAVADPPRNDRGDQDSKRGLRRSRSRNDVARYDNRNDNRFDNRNDNRQDTRNNQARNQQASNDSRYGSRNGQKGQGKRTFRR